VPEPTAEDELRATSDSILSDTERLASLEERKQRLQADDPAVVALSLEIEALSARLQRKATAVGEIAEELLAEALERPRAALRDTIGVGSPTAGQ
jgi:hypothetical protein